MTVQTPYKSNWYKFIEARELERGIWDLYTLEKNSIYEHKLGEDLQDLVFSHGPTNNRER